MEIFRPYGFDKPMFITTLILILFGLLMIFSSSAVLAGEKYLQPFYFLIQQSIGVVLGLFFIIFLVSIRAPFYQNVYFIYGLLILSVALLALCLIMPVYGGANRWIYFSGLRFQPSELSKISIILFLSSYLERKKDKLHEFNTLLFPLGIVLVFILLIIKEPDYGTAILICVISGLMLFIGGVKIKHFLFLGALSIGLFGFYLFKASYRLERIIAFLFPTKDPLGSGFQVIQSKIAVGRGGLFGVSIGESSQKLFFLPCAHTDYIYAIVGEEIGLIGTLAVLSLFVFFLWRGFLITRRAPNLFCQLLAAGLTIAIFSQALLNISIVIGLGPPTGFPLPLISFGRSSLISTLFGIAILLHISQRRTSIKGKK